MWLITNWRKLAVIIFIWCWLILLQLLLLHLLLLLLLLHKLMLRQQCPSLMALLNRRINTRQQTPLINHLSLQYRLPLPRLLINRSKEFIQYLGLILSDRHNRLLWIRAIPFLFEYPRRFPLLLFHFFLLYLQLLHRWNIIRLLIMLTRRYQRTNRASPTLVQIILEIIRRFF